MRFNDIFSTLIKSKSGLGGTNVDEIPEDKLVLSSSQHEKDYFAMLLTYAITFNDWQVRKNKERRGYNIGSILIDPDDRVVAHELNSITRDSDLSQHSEVRLIQNYLEKNKIKGLKGYSIYTTLEPCAMCSGMMTAVRLNRLVYGQKDIKYGGTFKKLEMDVEGYKSYPVQVQVGQSNDFISKSLDEKFRTYKSHIIKFLFSEQANNLFSISEELLVRHQVQFKRNIQFHKNLNEYLIRHKKIHEIN